MEVVFHTLDDLHQIMYMSSNRMMRVTSNWKTKNKER